MSTPPAEAQEQTQPLQRQAVGGDMGLLPSGDCPICSRHYTQRRLECESRRMSPQPLRLHPRVLRLWGRWMQECVLASAHLGWPTYLPVPGTLLPLAGHQLQGIAGHWLAAGQECVLLIPGWRRARVNAEADGSGYSSRLCSWTGRKP